MEKILITSSHFWPDTGGLEKYAYELATSLKKNYEVDVLTFRTGKQKPFEKKEGVNIYRIPSIQMLGTTFPVPKPCKQYFSTIKALKSKKHDLVITNTRFLWMSLIGYKLAKKTRHIHVEHGNRHVIHANKFVEIIARAWD